MSILPYILAFFKYVIYGSSVFFTSELEESCDVLDILALRFLMSFAFMWLLKVTGILKIKVGVKDFVKKNPRSPFIKSLVLAALFEPVLYMFFETLGISMTTNVTTAVIISLAPIFSCIAEVVFLKESCSTLQKIFLGVGIVGVIYIAVMTSTKDGNDSIIGILCLVGAITAGALFAVFSRKSSKAFVPMEITYVSAALGALIFNSVNVVRHIVRGDILSYFSPYFSVQNIIGFAFLGIVSAVLATGINNFCLSKMQVSTMAAFSGISTLVTIVIGVIFRDETLYYYHYVGLSLILVRMIGVSAISIKKDRNKLKIATAIDVGRLNRSKNDTNRSAIGMH